MGALPFAIDLRLDSPGDGQSRVLEVGAFALLSAVLGLRLFRRGPGAVVPIDLPTLAASATAACAILSSASASNPAFALAGTLPWLAGFVLFVLLRASPPQEDVLRSHGTAVVLQVAFLGLYGLAQRSGLEVLPYAGSPDKSLVVGTLGNPNFLGSFLAPALFICLARACTASGLLRAVSLSAATLGALAIVLARSRAAGLGVLLGLLATGGLLAGHATRRLRPAARWSAKAGLCAAGAALLALLTPVLARTSGGSLETRLYFWKVAAELSPTASPLGLGTGSFSTRFWAAVDRHQMTPEGRLFWRNLAALKGEDDRSRDPGSVHDDYLEMRLEWGWGALLGHLLLLLCVCFFTGLAIREGRAGAAQALLLGGLVASMVDSLFGFPLALPCSLALFWLIVAILIPAAPVPREPAPRPSSATATLVLLSGTAVALVASAASWRGDLLARRLVVSGDGLPLPVFLEQMRASFRLSPAAWKPLVPLAAALARRGADREALEPLEEALKRHVPIDALFLRAALQAHDEKIREALASFETLHRIEPANRSVPQYLLGLYAAAGRKQELARLAGEVARRWPGSFDALVALGNAALDGGDAVAGLRWKRLALAAAGPAGREFPAGRPVPALFDPAAERLAVAGLLHESPEGERP